MTFGQLRTGGVLSLTVTLNAQLGPAFTAADARGVWKTAGSTRLFVQVTVFMPTGKNDPEAGLQATVPQPPPVVVGAG